jgi:RNA polymerase sigma-70 factor (ECF subfamily)
MSSEGRQQQFLKLLDEHQARLFAFMYARVLNMADAEDLYQQVAMVLWQKFDQFQPGTDFGSWAVRVADFTIKNFLRGRRRGKVLFSDDVTQRIIDQQTTFTQDQSAARVDALGRCLKRLTDTDRQLVELCYGSDRAIKDIARAEGRSAGAIYTALCRIRQVLLACIERTIAAEAR